MCCYFMPFRHVSVSCEAGLDFPVIPRETNHKTRFYLVLVGNQEVLDPEDLDRFCNIPFLPRKRVCVTSPPYGIGILYDSYKDDGDRCITDLFECSYLGQSLDFVFLNLPSNPISVMDRWNRIIQNKANNCTNAIAWVKSISICDDTFGQFNPCSNKHRLNNCFEMVYLFSNQSNVLEKKAIGVPYKYKSNLKRFGHTEDKRCAGNVWFIPHETRNKKFEHPCPFPLELPRRCLKLAGVGLGDIVYDPFMGSGTTALAAYEMQASSFIGCEVSRKYIDLTIDRLLSAGVDYEQIVVLET